MSKIIIKNPIVEIDGDEMTRVIWEFIKDKLILPYIDIDIKYHDLGIENRNKSDDQVTIDAAEAVKKFGVGIKCATITPDEDRVKEFDLKKMWRSPNGTIRNILGGTIFRQPIICKNVPRIVTNWNKPIVVARHAFGDQYGATDTLIKKPGKLKMVFEPTDGSDGFIKDVYEFEKEGIALSMYNLDQSIIDFARACFTYGLNLGCLLYTSPRPRDRG